MHRISCLGLCLVLATAGFLFRETEAQSSAGKGCSLFPGIDFNGGDIDAIRTKTDGECCDLCQENSDCVAWTRIKDGRCFLKDTVADPTKCGKCTASGLIQKKLEISIQSSAKTKKGSVDEECVQFPNIDFFGGDISREVPSESNAQCCEFCISEPECVAWTRTKDGSCWLKNIQNEPTKCAKCTASGSILSRQAAKGRKPVPKTTPRPSPKLNKKSTPQAPKSNDDCFLFPGNEFPGGDLGDAVDTNSDAECCELCQAEPKCVAWTRYRNGDCTLKKKRNEATRCLKCSASGMILSRQEPSPKKECTHFPEIDFFGGDIGGGVPADTDDECCDLCLKEPICVSWTRTKKGVCWLKKTQTEASRCVKCSASGMILYRQSDSGSDSGSDSDSVPTADCVLLPGIDFLGGDIPPKKSIRTQSDDECCELCKAEPSCIVWTRTKTGRCWLKDVQEPPILCAKCSASGFIMPRQSSKDLKNLRAALKDLDLKDEPESLQIIAKNFLLSTDKGNGVCAA